MTEGSFDMHGRPGCKREQYDALLASLEACDTKVAPLMAGRLLGFLGRST